MRAYNALSLHATPADDRAYLLEDVSSGVPQPRTEREIAALVTGKPDAIAFGCGHSQIPGFIRAGRAYLNPGSVGLPAYDDTEPATHRTQTKSPDARSAILDLDEVSGVHRCDAIAVHCDHHTAAAKAEAPEFYAWAQWLRTGRCDPA